jgi:hypothetical protein
MVKVLEKQINGDAGEYTVRHKYKVGDVVAEIRREACFTILQKRIENGHLCYRLDDGRIVNETFLKA